jgi:hypothetical protein
MAGRKMRNPPGSRRVTRPGKWGNHGHPCDPKSPEARDRAAEAYEADFLAGRVLWHGKPLTVADAVQELGGLHLICYCPDDGHGCHANFLLRIANPQKNV